MASQYWAKSYCKPAACHSHATSRKGWGEQREERKGDRKEDAMEAGWEGKGRKCTAYMRKNRGGSG